MSLRAHLWLAFILFLCVGLLLALCRDMIGSDELDEPILAARLVALIVICYLFATREKLPRS